ncbi:MAG: hypothetical protein LBO03_09935 [Acidaminococcales bacterium]|nr:hypothetical protein [Acidaminococcales bacterium]
MSKKTGDSGKYNWAGKFLCVFFLVLTVFLARGYESVRKENRLNGLAVGETAESAAAAVAVWQEKQLDALLNIVYQTGGYYPEPDAIARCLAANPDWQAVFITDERGLIVRSAGELFEKSGVDFIGLTAQHDLMEKVTLFLQPPLKGVAIGAPFANGGAGATNYIYAVLDPKPIVDTLRVYPGVSAITLTDAGNRVLFSTDGLLVAGRGYREQKGEEISSLGGGFFEIKAAGSRTGVYRANPKGAFGWSLNAERPLVIWPFYHGVIYLSMFLTFFFFILSVWFYKKKPATGRECPDQAPYKLNELRKRMREIVSIDRNEEK